LYRELRYVANQADLHASETNKLMEVTRYLQANPSLKVGIDGSMNPLGTEPSNQDLVDRRVDGARKALILAGVPESKIKTGAFRDPQAARNGQVGVLLRTDN
jgi:outer membrane protein OmpA-like peptidoglycan-associated protein